MLMSCCCTNTYKFCKKISGCNLLNISFLFKGLPDDNYIVELDYLFGVIRIQMGVVGLVFTVVGPPLNESYTYSGKLFNSLGQAVPFVVNNITYDCFQFSTVMVAGFAGDIDAGSSAPPIDIDDVIEAIKFYDVIGETPSGAINGSNAIFTTLNSFDPASVQVFLNGLLQEPGVTYTLSGNNTITFTSSPEIGDVLEVNYIKD